MVNRRKETTPVSGADLYLEQIDLSRYLSGQSCHQCGADSCRELIELLQQQGCDLTRVEPDPDRRRQLERMLALGRELPRPPLLTTPRPFEPALLPLNDPGPDDPVLVTGNSELTQAVLMAVLSRTVSPLFVLFADTRGDTVDMALILGSMTAERLAGSAAELRLEQLAPSGRLILPGLASGLVPELAERLQRPVEAGPVCAAELPLFLGESWIWSD